MKKIYILLFISLITLIFNDLQAQQKPDKLPVYPGCEQSQDKMACMKDKILSFIGDEFNADLVKQIKDAKQVSMYISFVIDELGNIDDIHVKSGYDKLNKDMERTLRRLPKIKPAESEGYPIRMRYELPLVFDTGK